MAIDVNIPSQVKTYADLASFPATGTLKTIFIAEDTNKTYRWTGSAYVEISATAASTWGAIGGTLSNQTDLQNALNAKQDSLGFTAVPTTRTLTINGTTQDLSADRTFTVSTGITIGTTAITSGTVGRVLFEGTGNVVQESANLFWDNTNGRLGIGTSSPSEKFEIVSGAIQLSNAQPIRSRYTGGTAFTILQMFSDNNTYLDGGNDILFRVNAGATTAMRLKSATGNVLINTTTDAGFKLDVNGTARVSGRIDAGTFTAGAGASAYTIATTGRISAGNGITFRSPVVGDSDFTGFVGGGIGIQVFQNNASMFAFGGAGNLTSTIALATPNFAPSSGTGTKNIFEVGGTYNTTGTFTGTIRGFYYNPTLTSLVGTTHYAFHSTSGRIRFQGLPTSATGLSAGDVWNNLGILTIV